MYSICRTIRIGDSGILPIERTAHWTQYFLNSIYPYTQHKVNRISPAPCLSCPSLLKVFIQIIPLFFKEYSQVLQLIVWRSEEA